MANSSSQKLPMIIDGQSVTAAEYFKVINPSTLDVAGYAPQSTLDDLDAAVAAARKAQPAWAALADSERADICRKLSSLITENAAELSRLLTQEQGKPLKGFGSEFELGGCAAWMGAAADFTLPVKVLQDDETGLAELHRVPVGVIGSITPWNWPTMIAIWHIASAIRTGNTVVVKPSEFTPLSTLRMVELMNAELPPGVLNVVCGAGEIGAAMSAHKDIDKIVFTGSARTGRKVMQNAADNFKRLTLELGGNDAGVVLPGADIEKMAEGIFWGAFLNSGQTCAALKRLYVHESQYEELCERLTAIAKAVPMGDGLDESSVLGPLQNENQFNIVKSLVDDAKAHGGRVLIGGEPLPGKGYYYPVTLIADVKDGMRIVDEEQFGTVLPIIAYSDLEDAINNANGLDFGLAASVWGESEQARKIANRLEAGTVYINQHGAIAPHIPFGGIKGSGIGVEFGQEGLAACTNVKVYNMAR